MTREDIDKCAEKCAEDNMIIPDDCHFYDSDYEKFKETYIKTFKSGVEYADSHSKSHWISVNDDLPYNHEELIEIIYQSNHFLLKGTKYVFVKYKNGHYGIEHMIKTSVWEWYQQNSDIVYWMPIPELPK